MAEPASRSARFARNTVHYFLGEASLFALTLAVVPVLVRRLGADGYALYSLMGILAGYMSLFIAGSGASAVKLVAEALARGDRARFHRVLRISLAAFVAGGGLAALVLVGLRRYLAERFLKIPPELADAAETIFLCAAGGGFFYLLSMWCGFILQGMQRFDLLNILSVFRGAMVPSGCLALMLAGLPLTSLGAWYLAANLAAFLLGLWWIRGPVAEALGARGGGGESLGRIFVQYNLNAFVGQLAYTINCQLDKLWIGHLFPIGQVAYYVIPGSLAQRLGTIPSIICQVAFPMISEIGTLGDHAALKRLYIKASKVVVLSLSPVFVILFAWAPQILGLWLGPDFREHGTWPMRLQLLGWSASLLTVIPFHVALGLGKPLSISTTASAASVVIVAAWSYLIPRHGIFGAALGFCIGQLVVAPTFVVYITRKLVGISATEYLSGSYLAPAGSALLLGAAAWLIGPSLERIDALALAGAALGAAYLAVNYVFLDREERGMLLRIFRRG